MSLQHIVDAANQLAREGKKPSVALIKTRLSQPASIRDIIETLKTFHYDPLASSIGSMDEPQRNSDEGLFTHDAQQQQIDQQIQVAIAPLQREINELKAQLNEFRQLLAQH